MTAGELIRQARLADGLTQAQLARRLGVTQPAIARLEAAEDAVTISTLQRALNAMSRTLELRSARMRSSVDETLLLVTLGLTPAQRLERFESWYEDMRAIAGVAQREPATAP